MPKQDSPHVVRTTAGVLVVHCDTENQAQASVKDRNERAERMGLQVRYVYSYEPETV